MNGVIEIGRAFKKVLRLDSKMKIHFSIHKEAINGVEGDMFAL